MSDVGEYQETMMIKFFLFLIDWTIHNYDNLVN